MKDNKQNQIKEKEENKKFLVDPINNITSNYINKKESSVIKTYQNDKDKEIPKNEAMYIKIGNNNISNVPKFSQNAEKLKELEDKILNIESTLNEVKEKIQSNKITREENKKEVLQVYKETKSIHNDFSKSLSEKIKNAFIKDFDMASKEIIQNEKEMMRMKEKAYEYENLITELDTNYDYLYTEKKKLEELYADVKNEYDYLKESYDDLITENTELRRQNEQKEERILGLENDLDDMKNVIGKLTEVRVVLNKYFSSHFENFTQNEKKIIQQIQSVIDDNSYRKSLERNEVKDSLNNPHLKQDVKIFDEEEYKNYQNRLKNSKASGKSDLDISKYKSDKNGDNEHNLDDQFWFQKKNDTKNKSTKYDFNYK